MPITRWLVAGDIHDKTDALPRIKNIDQYSGMIVTGDITLNGGANAAASVLEQCAKYTKVVAAQIGNMDKADVTLYLHSQGINLHGSALQLADGAVLIGAGGSNITPFSTASEFSEGELKALLGQALKSAGTYKHLIVVSHCPPFDTLCDGISGGVHVGSRAVRSFIEQVQPDICLCGHIHESIVIDEIGKTKVVNPGAFMSGNYAELVYDGTGFNIELKQV